MRRCARRRSSGPCVRACRRRWRRRCGRSRDGWQHAWGTPHPSPPPRGGRDSEACMSEPARDIGKLPRLLAPLAFGILALVAWDLIVRLNEIPPYILPGPLVVIASLWTDGPSLLGSLWITLKIAFAALALAAGIGLAIALLLAQSRWIEASLLPYAIALQVTPIVAIAPLIIIWTGDAYPALLICAWIVAFFPIVSNTTLGLNSADRGLGDLFQLYGASRTQTLLFLRLPTALPYFL